MFKLAVSTALAVAMSTAALWAGDITVTGAYARSNSPMAKVGAIFMEITNASDHAVRLVSVNSPAAELAEIHTHLAGDGGVMKMTRLGDGLTIPAGATVSLERGGDHVMLMGLTAPLAQGDMVPVTLNFDGADALTLDVPVDLKR